MKSILIITALMACINLSNCASDTSTDQEISQAQTAVKAASFGLDIAEMAYAAKMADPSTDPVTRLVATQTLQKARTHLAEEQAKLAAIQQKRLDAATATALAGAATGPSNPLLPPPGAGL